MEEAEPSSVGRFPAARPDAGYPLPPPTPNLSANPPTFPFHTSAPYAWPGSDKSPAYEPIDLNLRTAAGHLLWDDEFGRHTDPDDPARHIGLGEPLVGTSWLNRPCYSALLFGSMIADDMRSNVELHNGLFIGFHQGWDFDHFYGAEFRLAGGSYDVYDSPTDATAGMAFLDAHLLYYPWGDARWRPYYSLGLGLAFHHARVSPTEAYDATVIGVPLGIGVKYQWQRHCAMRFDIKHNLSFSGGGVHGMDNVSLSAGLEYRYGGRPKSYFPWNPSIYLD